MRIESTQTIFIVQRSARKVEAIERVYQELWRRRSQTKCSDQARPMSSIDDWFVLREKSMSVLNGKVAFITGGAGGLGAAISHTFAEAGAQVVVADIRKDQANEVCEAIRRKGGTAMPMTIDLLNEEAAMGALDVAAREFGGLDILVNNAGTDLTVSVDEMSVADWDRILAVNLRAPFLLAKGALPLLRQRGGGHIINITSTAAKRCWANASAYHASKWGLLGFSHALHVEGRKDGVKVTAVVAGGMRTPFLTDRFPDIDQTVLQDPYNVAQAILHVLQLPAETVIPEITVLPMRETSWP